jgi:hypothetical protein
MHGGVAAMSIQLHMKRIFYLKSAPWETNRVNARKEATNRVNAYTLCIHNNPPWPCIKNFTCWHNAFNSNYMHQGLISLSHIITNAAGWWWIFFAESQNRHHRQNMCPLNEARPLELWLTTNMWFLCVVDMAHEKASEFCLALDWADGCQQQQRRNQQRNHQV